MRTCMYTKVKATRRLLNRMDGVPVMGFFSVDRGMVLVIFGQTLTYLIIMLEFKNEVDGVDGSNLNQTMTTATATTTSATTTLF